MPENSNDDYTLLRRMERGDEAAFEELYSRHQRRIFRFAWHMSRDNAMAEEITQDVFMTLIKKPRGYAPERGSFAAYIYGVTRNLIRCAQRENPLQVPITEETIEAHEELFADRFDVLAELSRTELLECLRKALLALPEPYREVLVLRDMEQMGHRETAELLQCSMGTVASRLHRARALLKARLQSIGCAT